MLSSTSSSNDRIPRGSWPQSWLLTVAIVGVLLGGWEITLRLRGIEASIEADREAWILTRAKLRPGSTVITGSSRIQAVIEPGLWMRELGGDPPIDLALAGSTPLPVLEDLAADSSFHGLVLAEILPMYAFDLRSDGETILQEHLKAYRDARSSPASRWEAWLRVYLLGHFAFRREAMLPKELIPKLMAGHFPLPPYNSMRPDRYHPVSWQRAGIRANRPELLDTIAFRPTILETRPAQGATLDSLFRRIQHSVESIRRHGGQVVFLRFPACGGRRILEEEYFPAGTYWAPLRELTKAPMIDLGDYPEVTSLHCYDGSHIDVSEVPPVERLIAEQVKQLVPAAVGP
ncbi:MAG: hypothetical protein ABI742_04015 [Gemmatimonadota bacterium]